MAKATELIKEFVEHRVISDYLEHIMGDRFGSYAKAIIQDRAIPDVRDGLKPVQRRILYGMYAQGWDFKDPYKKCARIVGEVMGKFHPHGDSSIYEALVRMSQDFKINVPLIDMQGNNGSIDGDGAAAMRYTEARLSRVADFLLNDLGKKTVPFIPNYDDSTLEPIVLPAKFPNLLVNGSDGISAGYATSIPPHNLSETIDLTIARIRNSHLTIDEAMTYLPGPDFPTGGLIIDTTELRRAFETGRGKVTIRSRAKIENNQIIISEIPYDVNKSLLVKKIDTIATSKEIDGISEVRDESDKEGLRIVIDLKEGASGDTILNYLYKKTELQVNFSYNLVAIVDKSPKTLGILDVIDAYILHSKDVITNRSNFEKEKANARLHIVDGFIKLSSIINEVVETIKNSKNKADAKINIEEKFGFTDLQAEAIVTLQLYRLTNTDIMEFRDERDNLVKEIAKLEAILSSERKLTDVIVKELEEVKEAVGTPRKSEICNAQLDVSFNEEDLVMNERVHLHITRDGYIKKMTLKSYQASILAQTVPGIKEGDYVVYDSEVNSLDTIIVFTTQGEFINIPVYKLNEIKLKDVGDYLGSMYDLLKDSKVLNIFCFSEKPDPSLKVLLATKLGKVKVCENAELFSRKNKSATAIKLLEPHDELVSVCTEDADSNDVVTVTKEGMIIRYSKAEIPTIGFKAAGVNNITIKGKDEVVSTQYVCEYPKEELLLLTSKGSLKRVFVKNITLSKRAYRGEAYLKKVKSNPLYFTAALSTNPSKYKESLSLNVLTEKGIKSVNLEELPKDNLENGVPFIEKGSVELMYLSYNNYEEYEQTKKALSKDYQKRTPQEEVSPSLLEELGDIISEQKTIFDYADYESKDDEQLKDDLF